MGLIKFVHRLQILVFVSFLLIALVFPASLPPAGASASGKILPWVAARMAEGDQTEILIILADQADLHGAQALSTRQAKGRFVRDALWNKAQVTQSPLIAWLQTHQIEYRSFYIVNAIWAKTDRATIERLAARPDVARIEGNPHIASPLLPPPDFAPQTVQPSAVQGVEPGIAYVHAPEVWAMGYRGQGIVVGGQDTGYDWAHPALKPHYRGWNGAAASHDYNWHDSIHSGGGVCGSNSPQPCDDNEHGTHTMGTAVGDDGAGNQVGMAPGAKWIGCRNMDQGVGSPATYLECYEFFLAPYPVNGTPAQGDPSRAPDVTTNSWTCPQLSEGCSADSLLAAVEAQRAAGIMTVAAAGNEGPSCSTVSEPPSFYDGLYTVGALATGTDSIAGFSNRGPVTIDGSGRIKPDIAAPGTSVRSSTPGGGYGSLSGTSMATPHVAGAVALLWSAVPALKNHVAETESVLNQSAHHLASTECGSSGWPNNTFGYGRLDVQAAVLAGAPSGVAGTVRDAVTLLPVSGAQVAVWPGGTPSGTTGAEGAYGVSLDPGKYTLQVTASGYLTTQTQVTVSLLATTPLDIALPPLVATLQGQVIDAGASLPIPGAVITVETAQAPLLTATTGVDGTYSISLPAGAFDLRISALGYMPVRVSGVTLISGSTVTQNVSLSPAFQLFLPIVASIHP